jgi:superfamily II DNA or RNA helicase
MTDLVLETKKNLEQVLLSDSSIKQNIRAIQYCLEILKPIAPPEVLTEINSKIKSRVQMEARYAFNHSKHKGFGAILAATGTGKSKIAVDEVGSMIEQTFGKGRALIVVPTEKLRDDNWKEEFAKWGADIIWETRVDRECYASLSKIEGKTYDLVILDEGHNITPHNAVFFEQNTVKACMLLTATKPKDAAKIEVLRTLNIYPVYQVSLDEAVALGLVAPYEITVVTTKLDRSSRNIKAGRKDKPFYQTEYDNYKYLCKVIDEKERPTKFDYLNRMRMVYNLPSKTTAALWIKNHLIPKTARTLFFCGSIAQAETIHPHTFHSKTDSFWFEQFKNGEIDWMSCVDAVNEGHNIDNLDCGFIIQLNSNELDLVQRIGRLIRYRPGHTGKVIILCSEETVDKKWVGSATVNLTGVDIRWISFDDLRSGKEKIEF